MKALNPAGLIRMGSVSISTSSAARTAASRTKSVRERPRSVAAEASERVKLSERTLTDLKDLLTRFDQVRKQGYAISDGENAYGLRTIAAPVFGDDNSVIAGVSLTIDANRMDIKVFRAKALPEMLRVAKTLADANRRSGLPL